MKRRSFLKRLALVPVMASIATDLLFSQPKINPLDEPLPESSHYPDFQAELGDDILPGDLIVDHNENVYCVISKNQVRPLKTDYPEPCPPYRRFANAFFDPLNMKS